MAGTHTKYVRIAFLVIVSWKIARKPLNVDSTIKITYIHRSNKKIISSLALKTAQCERGYTPF